jgi:outer membrane immunogenic protein
VIRQGVVVKKLLGGIAIAALAAGSAIAADMSPPPPPPPVVKAPPPVYVFSWTGFYVGVNAGWARGNFDHATTPNAAIIDPTQLPITAPFVANQYSLTFHPSGFTGGIQAGYNYQVSNFVAGWEVDVEYFGLRNSLAFGPVIPPGVGSVVSGSMSVKTDYLATFRGRLGGAFDRGLFYVTGGGAVSTVKLDIATTGNFGGLAGFLNASESRTRLGWVAGAGIEYAFLPNWTIRAEYLHVDLGTFDTNIPFTGPFAVAPPACVGCALNTHSYIRADIVRAALNYKFDWGPVVARY